jgi:serine phosphatase RsbU (regulator of sigma subunit)
MKKLLLFVFLFAALMLQAQSRKAHFDDKSRAIYILDIAKYIEWPDTIQSTYFRVGILAHDSALFRNMVVEAAGRDSLHGKPIRVYLFTHEDAIHNVDIIFFKKTDGFDISKVFEMIGGKPVLMITEGYPYHMSMINFIVLNGRKKYEVNKNKMLAAGLRPVELFVLSGVKSEADWSKLYEESVIKLAEEQRVVTSQKKQIEAQKKEIEQQLATIKKQKAEIRKQLQHLAELNREIEAKQKELEHARKRMRQQREMMALQQAQLDSQQLALTAQKQEMQKQKAILEKQQADIEAGEQQIMAQKARINEQLAKIEQQQLILYISVLFILLLAGLGYFIYRSYKIKKQANIALEQKNALIEKQNEEITKQRDIAREQRDRIAAQKKEIMDSIVYAQRIQKAILPNIQMIKESLEHFFILFKPRDIVSGDFYWESRVGDEIIVIAADCTGHGVPGAFMSMLGVTFLNEIVNSKRTTKPGEILNMLRDKVIKSLNQQYDNPLRDGMDISVINYNFATKQVSFAGANNPLFLIQGGELTEIKADKMPIALYDKMVSFSDKTVELKSGDCLYIFSDGYVDQFGGPKGKKFMKKRFKQLLLDNYHLPMEEQRELLDRTYEEWKAGHEQVDDVLVIGLKI